MNDWLFVPDYCVNCLLLRLSRARLVVTAAVAVAAVRRPRAVAVKALRAEKQLPVVRRLRAARAVGAVKRLRVAATPAVRAEWPAQAALPARE